MKTPKGNSTMWYSPSLNRVILRRVAGFNEFRIEVDYGRGWKSAGSRIKNTKDWIFLDYFKEKGR